MPNQPQDQLKRMEAEIEHLKAELARLREDMELMKRELKLELLDRIRRAVGEL